MNAPTRPALRWHGGKWRLAPWIIEQFPTHHIYTEAFGGAASVLLRKPRCYAEVYNDLDHEVVNLFRVLRDPASAARLLELVRLTPFAREEFRLSYEESSDPIENARRFLFRSSAGYGSNAHCRRQTGFRAQTTRAGTTPAGDWATFADALPALIERWRGVVIECRDAIETMARHDGPDTLHYVDPPYLPETRSPANKYDLKYRMYKHELDRGGACSAADPSPLALRHGGALRLSRSSLRRRAGRLAPRRDAGLRRWRTAAGRGAVAQPSVRRCARPRGAAAQTGNAVSAGGRRRIGGGHDQATH